MSMSGRRFGKTFLSFSIISLFLFSLISISSAQIVAPEGPGIEWEKPDSHRLFLKGEASSPFLDNNWSSLTGQPIGSVDFQKTVGSTKKVGWKLTVG